jgi:DNA polymerase-3 subunit epsilon
MHAASLIRDIHFVAIDFESAGAARGMTDVPIQIGLASWSIVRGHQNAFVSYLHADGPITWAAQKVHGITRDDLLDAPSLRSLWPTLKEHLHGHIVVAHGKGTEKRFLRAFPGHGFGPWVDTLLLARAVWPQAGDHSLGSLCSQLALTSQIDALCPNKTWHDALYDAIASLCLLEKIIALTSIGHLPISQLLPAKSKKSP